MPPASVTRTGIALASEESNHRTHFQMLVEDEEGRELLFDAPQVMRVREARFNMAQPHECPDVNALTPFRTLREEHPRRWDK